MNPKALLKKYRNRKIEINEGYKLSRGLRMVSGGDNIDETCRMLNEINEKGLIRNIIFKERKHGFIMGINTHNKEEMKELRKIFEKYNTPTFEIEEKGCLKL
ncbi:hypothetical protein LCGC14_2252720 [marine sediment metagenome]|uniref:Uncharacterized protein n=1 Tax=marine sediment metagenome TaxID=412755 RepID=A0A0F9D1U8_9ZZZZ